jgi:hypothetical protein
MFPSKNISLRNFDGRRVFVKGERTAIPAGNEKEREAER